MSSLVGNIVCNKCYLHLETFCMSRAAIFEIKISGNLSGLQTVLCTLEEENKDTSHIFLPNKRANKMGNLAPLSIVR